MSNLAHRLRRALGRLTDVAFVTSSESASNQITIPASAQEGDFAILVDSASSGDTSIPTDVIPTDWTGIDTRAISATFSYRGRISCKILTASDPGATITGIDGSFTDDKLILVFRGSRAVSSFVLMSPWNGEATAGNPSSQSAAASGGSAPLIVVGSSAIPGGTAAFSTASPAFDDTVARSDGDILVGYKIYNTSPADHTIDQNDLGNQNWLTSGYIELY